MNVLSRMCVAACLCGFAAFGSHVNAALIVDLDPVDALVDYVDGDPVDYGNDSANEFPDANRALGHTVNATITPDTADVSGAVVIMEYGGTANGFNLGLVDGVLTYMAKHNSGDPFAPDSLNDTSLRPDGSTRGEAAVQSSAAALSPGIEYSVAVSWDQAGNLQLGLFDGSGIAKDSFTLTGQFDNWSGNNSLAVGEGLRSFGGYSGEVGGNTVPDPFDVDETPVNSFAGTISDLLYWNDAGTVVPEPTSLVLVMLGTSLCYFATRYRS